MPSTFAFTFWKLLIVSRNVHISFVQVPLNAPGKNARTTLPSFSTWLSVTFSRSWLTSVKSGALLPTSTAIDLSPCDSPKGLCHRYHRTCTKHIGDTGL